jgi:hypothetical protein
MDKDSHRPPGVSAIPMRGTAELLAMAEIVDDFDKINLTRELKHEIICSRKDFTK